MTTRPDGAPEPMATPDPTGASTEDPESYPGAPVGDPLPRTLRESLTGLDSYALLFVLLIVDYMMLILVDSPRWQGLATAVPVSLTVVLALHTSAAGRRALAIAWVAVGACFVVGLGQLVSPHPNVRGTMYVVLTVLLVMAPLAIVRRVLQHERVEVSTLLGGLDVYIIIGLTFSTLFIALAYLHPHPPFLAQLPRRPHDPVDYVYLSFVTLTTVGFGDLTPKASLARSVVVLEALIGQIFLVTMVARLVSMYSASTTIRFGALSRRQRREARDAARNPGRGSR
jgi:hypothetical protein